MRFTVSEIKNKARRLLSVALSMCILCGLLFASAPASFASNGEELVDIKGHWAETVIKEWVSRGLIKGYGNGRFGPNDSITRAEFVTLLNRIFCYTQKSNVSFPDVKKGVWYAGEIAKAYQAGNINGDNKGNI